MDKAIGKQGSLKADQNTGLIKTYISKKVFLVTPDLIKCVFKSVNKNSNTKLLSKRFYEDFEVHGDYLDMNESFTLFSFFIHKFELINKDKLEENFNLTITTNWNEIIDYLSISQNGTVKKWQLNKYKSAFERLRVTKLKFGKTTSGLISEYDNEWSLTEKNRLDKSAEITIKFPQNLINYIKYNKRVVLVSYDDYNSIVSQTARKLYLYLKGISKTVQNEGITYKTLKKELAYEFSYFEDDTEKHYSMIDKDCRRYIKDAIKELKNLGFIFDSNILHRNTKNIDKYKFYHAETSGAAENDRIAKENEELNKYNLRVETFNKLKPESKAKSSQMEFERINKKIQRVHELDIEQSVKDEKFKQITVNDILNNYKLSQSQKDKLEVNTI